MRHSVSLLIGSVDEQIEFSSPDAPVLETYEKGIENRHDEHGLGVFFE